jgi:glyoxylase-like metal-dependent hydrolase (beta-lactamase superfamily II)
MLYNALTRCLLSVLAVVACRGASAQQDVDWDAIEITVHHVAGSVYMLEGRGGNIGLSIGEDGVIMIDDQFAPLTERIVAAIREVSDGEIRFLINTHVHGDHTGGNENLGNMGVVILANDLVRVRLTEGIRGGPPAPEVALPILTYNDTMTVHLNGEEVRAFSVPPAHTDGDSFIHFRSSNVIHLGDVFRTNNFPYIDVENGGTLEGTVEALGIAIGMLGPDTLIIPGHGVVSMREDVMEFRDMLLTVRARVSQLVAEGQDFDEVLAARPTAEFEERWGDPLRFLTGLYAEVGGR